VLCHFGSGLGSGHYVAHIFATGRWLLSNDARVSPVRQTSGPGIGATVVALVYVRESREDHLWD
jgi:ubiquitin C-terminal hydrolase